MEKIKTITIGLLILVLFGMWYKCSRYRSSARQAIAIALDKGHAVQYYRDQNNIEHATAAAEALDYQQLTMLYRDSLAHLAALLRVKPKQIGGIATISTQTKGSITIPLDSAGKGSFGGEHIDGTAKLLHDTLYIEYAFTDSVVLTDYWRRKWLLGRKQYYVDGFAMNPDTHLTGLSALRLKAKEPGRFGIGPALNIDISGRVTFGLSFTYSIIRF
jgi:hypothetical protein